MRYWLAVLIALLPTPLLAWNALGHKVIAEIAWRQLTPEQRQPIVDTLRHNPRFVEDFANAMPADVASGDTAKKDRWIFQQAATWPDLIRRNKEYDRPSWHYVDLPLFLNPTDKAAFAGKLPVNISTEYPTQLPIDEYNVLQAIAHSKAAIKSNAGRDVKAVAYCWLFHLVGDIHQPLHSTALFSVERFPKGDRGGNDIPLRRGRNLHALWDGLLGTDSKMSGVDRAVHELSDKQRFGDIWQTAANETDPRRWADESHTVCESVVYDDAILTAVRGATSPKLEPIELPAGYFTKAGEIARQRILAAALRLAQTLRTAQP